MIRRKKQAAARRGAAREPRRIQSIEVGFRLIRALETAGAPLPLKDVAARAEMPPSNALLYLASFLALGFVVRDEGGQYSLGPYALQLGLVAIAQLDVIELAPGAMASLQEATGQSVYLSIWGRRGPSIVRKLDSELAVPVAIKVGSVLPLASSATGRVYLAFLPESLTRPILVQEPEAERLPDGAVGRIVAAVRRDGVAASDSQLNLGFAALAAPIFDYRGELAGAMTVLGPSARIDPDPRHRLARQVRAAAAAVSRKLGCPPETPSRHIVAGR